MADDTGIHRGKDIKILETSAKPIRMLTRALRYVAMVLGGLAALFVVGSWIFPSSGRDRVTDTDRDYGRTGGAIAIAASYDPECTRSWYPLMISGDPNSPTQVNPRGNCDWTLRMPGHCIMGKRADRVSDDKPYGPYCDVEGSVRVEVKDDIEWVWAVDLDGRPAEPFAAEARLLPDP